jgi:hypothetical protein
MRGGQGWEVGVGESVRWERQVEGRGEERKRRNENQKKKKPVRYNFRERKFPKFDVAVNIQYN